jgi:transglutaminase-like putative cysteine protease
MSIPITQHERRRYRYRPKLKAAGDWRLGERLPVLLALLASLALLVAKRGTEWSRGAMAAVWLGEVIVVTIAHLWVGKTAERRERWLKLGFPTVAVGMLGPALLDPLTRSALSRGQTLDGLLLDGLGYSVLGLAIFGYHPALRRLCCAGSLFLTVFSCCLSNDPFVLGLVVAYAVLGVWWLMGSYWEGLQGKLAAESQEPLPRRWLFGLPALVVAVLLLIPWNGRESLLTLWGFLPSSGGTGDFDEFARSGVNDGDLLVGAKDNARSFGPVESEVFMDSEQPSLYDVFNDMYGEPVKNKKQERAVALPADLMREAEQRMAQSRTVGREFSTVRLPKAAKEKPTVADIDGRALFHVQGRTPLHLRLELYDLFDGRDWLPMPNEKHASPLQLRTIAGKPWIELTQGAVMDVFDAEESHALKIHRLDTSHLPLPIGATRLHIDRIDRPDFFAITQPTIIRLIHDQLPPQLVLHITSRPQDESQIARWTKGPGASLNARMVAVPVATRGPRVDGSSADEPDSLTREPRVATLQTLAREWTANAASGWPQVHAIVQRLRRDFVLDNEAVVPADDDDPVHHFLFESRRGPDYLFATSAAMLLRSLGYPTRMVSGFYANPANYDARRQHTAVLPEDVHFWPEVYIGAATWVTVEPTPGFEVLGPPPTWWQMAWSAVVACAAFVAQNAVVCSLLTVTLILSVTFRHRIAERIASCAWWLGSRRESRQLVLNTARLLERRGRLAGLTRPRHCTPARWLRRLNPRSTDLLVLARLVEWADFAPASNPLPRDAQPTELCRHAVQQWTVRQFAQETASCPVHGGPRLTATPSACADLRATSRRAHADGIEVKRQFEELR